MIIIRNISSLLWLMIWPTPTCYVCVCVCVCGLWTKNKKSIKEANTRPRLFQQQQKLIINFFVTFIHSFQEKLIRYLKLIMMMILKKKGKSIMDDIDKIDWIILNFEYCILHFRKFLRPSLFVRWYFLFCFILQERTV